VFGSIGYCYTDTRWPIPVIVKPCQELFGLPIGVRCSVWSIRPHNVWLVLVHQLIQLRHSLGLNDNTAYWSVTFNKHKHSNWEQERGVKIEQLFCFCCFCFIVVFSGPKHICNLCCHNAGLVLVWFYYPSHTADFFILFLNFCIETDITVHLNKPVHWWEDGKWCYWPMNDKRKSERRENTANLNQLNYILIWFVANPGMDWDIYIWV